MVKRLLGSGSGLKSSGELSGSSSSPSCCICTVCAKYPFRQLEPIIPQLAEQEAGWDAEKGIYEFLYREEAASVPRLPSAVARKTADRCARHTKRLQADLVKGGLLNKEGQKIDDTSGETRVLAPFDADELRLGRMLGTGGFSAVFVVSSVSLDSKKKYTPQEQDAREELERNVLAVPTFSRTEKAEKGKQETSSSANSPPEPQYAIKHLRRALIKEPEKFERAAIDMVLEAQLLLSMDHPNIISLRGWTGEGVQGYASGRNTDFFILIDRLVESLDERMALWRNAHKKYKGRSKLLFGKQKFSSKLGHLLEDRLLVAQQIAAALEYMHDRRIIYRDLKSSNIGFDVHGTLKLFDFGLSRLLPSRKSAMHDGYTMSRVGTKYYMAPEVRAKAPYNLTADMYSFGVVLWEIMSLSSPRETLQKCKRDELVPSRRCNLPVCECWPEYVQSVVEKCLLNDPHLRPKAGEVCNGLVRRVGVAGGSRSVFRIDSSTQELSSASNYSFCTYRSTGGMSESVTEALVANTVQNFG